MSDDSKSHAREIPPCPEDVAGRVDFIAELMAELQWERGKSAKALAKAWGLSVSAIENYSAEASRRVTADAGEIRREITVRGLKHLSDAKDPKAFAAVGKLLADVSGANAPSQHQIGSMDQATPAEASRLIRERFGGHAMKDDDETGDTGPADTGGVPGDPSVS